MDPSAVGSQGLSHSESGFESASGGGDTELDFKSLFADTQSQLKETQDYSSRLSQDLENVKGEAGKSNAELARIKSAILNESTEAEDPVAQEIASLEAEMDQYLQAGIDAERRNQPIPLTVSNAVRSLKHQIAYAQDRSKNQAELLALREQVKQLSNPRNVIDQTAYNNMDSHIQSAIQTIFGTDDESADVRSAQFDAVSRQVINEIKNVQKTDPDLWDRIRRDQKAQRNMVNHFVQKSIPPRARQIMDNERIRTTPLTTNELMNAFREAKELALKDPAAARHVSEVRQELLARMMEKNMGGGSSQARINDLF